MLRVSSDLTRPAFSPATRIDIERAILTLSGAEPIWSCSGWGLPGYPDHSGYGELLPRLFTLTLWNGFSRHPTGRYLFCGTFLVPVNRKPPFSQKQSVLRTTLPCGARTFLPSCSPFSRIQEERPSVPLRLSPFLQKFKNRNI